jgi:hypothetical protein
VPGASVAAELAHAEEADWDVQVRGCKEGEALDDVFGLGIASIQGDGGRAADRRLGDDIGCRGSEAGANAAGEGEDFRAAGVD